MNKMQLDTLAWVVVALTLAWVAHDRIEGERPMECQAYDVRGHGIGCEGRDLTDVY